LEKQVEPYHPEYAANRVKSALERVEEDLQRDLMRWFAEFLDDLTGVQKIAKDEPLPGFLLARLNDQIWWKTWSEKLSEILTSNILSAMRVGGQSAGRQLGMNLSWDYIQPAAVEWARQNAGKLVTGILPDIQTDISQIVMAGLSEGKTIYQIRDEIAGLRDDAERAVFPEWRAARIARTEVIRAHAQGAKLGYLESGVVSGMRWLDGQTGACPKCRELHNKTIRLGEKFYIDPKFGDGLPPRHPHCRCAVAPVTLDQVKYLPADHPLRENRRNSIEEITDIQAYTEIGGVRVTGERLRHAQYKHPEIKGMIDMIQRGLLSPDAITDKGEVRVYHIGLNRISSRGNPLYFNIAVRMGESPFMLTSYIAPIKK
jgi:SPP1 gp7 family putative phage head morphogenesis protein